MTQELARRASTVTIEDARIFFRNFAGREGQYNAEGDRNFGVALPENVAQEMLKDGWNVKYLKPREEGDVPQAWVPVSVSYRNRPPRVVMVAQKFNPETGEFDQIRTNIPEELVEMLDYADMAKVDLMLNPYTYNVNGRAGVKAYLRSIYVTIRMDALEEKYAAIPEVEFGSGMLQIEAGPGEDEIIEGEVLEDFEDFS